MKSFFKKNKVLGERKENEDSVGVRYHQKYKLGKSSRIIPWELTDSGIEENEKILMAFYYRKVGNIANRLDGDEWHGLNNFTFYLIENEGNVYVKYFDFRKLQGLLHTKATEYGYKNFINIPLYMAEDYGRKTEGYKQFLLNEVCVIIHLDKAELYEKMKELESIDFSNSFLDFFNYTNSNEALDYYDNINKNIFYTDSFCSIKYKKCVDFFEYVLLKCNILNMTKTTFEFFEEENRETIMKKLIDLAIEEEKEELNNFE